MRFLVTFLCSISILSTALASGPGKNLIVSLCGPAVRKFTEVGPADAAALREVKKFNFGNFLVSIDSHGSHGSSPDRPRVIGFSEEQGLIQSVSPSSSPEKGVALERMEFDGEELSVSKWDKDRWIKNPAECMGCHRYAGTNRIHGRWDIYPFWPGFLGGVHGQATAKAVDLAAAITALTTRPEYAFVDASILKLKSSFNAEVVLIKMNEAFDSLINFWNIIGVEREIRKFVATHLDLWPALAVITDSKSRVDFLKLIPAKYQVPGRSLEQRYAEVLADTKEKHGQYLMLQLSRFDTFTTNAHKGSSVAQSSGVAKLRFIFEVLGGLDIRSWSMANPNLYAFGNANSYSGDEFLPSIMRSLQAPELQMSGEIK